MDSISDYILSVRTCSYVHLNCVCVVSQANAGPHSNHQDAVLKGLSVLGGLYLLFVFESALGIRQSYKVSFAAALHSRTFAHFYISQ